MRDSAVATLESPDETLIASTRSGDRRAFAELWRRHYRSGLTVARQFTNIDADDLVSESFARIYKRTVDGGGPNGAFRPYLYTTIRNLACTWGTQSRDIQVDEIDDLGSHESAEAPVARSLDRALTVSAYRSLPSRWQTVLWYTEVEGLDPQEVGPIMGLTSNAVAALAYRAREGLRKAWLQAHVNDATASGACQWVVTRLGEHSRHSLTEREEQRLTGHLAICAKCAIVSEEVDDVGARLAMVMIPLLLGGVAGGGLLATLGTAGAGAGAATASAIPALPASIGAIGATSAATGGGVGLLAIAASAVIIAGASAGIGLATNPDHSANSAAPDSSSSQNQAAAGSGSANGSSNGDTDGEPGPGGEVSDAGDDLATTIPESLLTPALPTDTTALPGGEDDPLGTITDDPTRGGTVDKTLEGVDTTVDKVTDTVDKVTETVDKVGDTVDKVVDKVIPPKKDGKGSGVGDVVEDVTDTVDGVTGEVDDLVGGLTDGLGSGLGGLLDGGKKG